MMRTLVVGGAGALGRAMVRDLAVKGFNPICVDFAANADIPDNILLDSSKLLKDQSKDLVGQIKKKLDAEGSDLKSVFCAAGGWAGGSIGDDNILDALHDMNRMNLDSAVLSAHLATRHLCTSGLLVLTGAEAALNPTPGMLAYGLSKVSTHYLIKSLAVDPDFSGKKATALGILPMTIDTPTNRQFMADADFGTWTPPEEISKLCVGYVTGMKL